MESNTEGPLKTKNRVTIRSCNPTPEHISGKNYNSKRCVPLNVHCSITFNSQDVETN